MLSLVSEVELFYKYMGWKSARPRPRQLSLLVVTALVSGCSKQIA